MVEQAAVGEQTAVTLEETRPVGRPPMPPQERPPDREIWPWLLVLLVLVLAGIAAVYFATRKDNKRANRDQVTQTVVQTVTPTATSTPRRPVEPARVTVPRLVGLPAPTALERLQQAGLTGTTHGVSSKKPRNQVVSQAPGPSQELAKGATVTLNVSKGPKTAPVPDVVGQSTADALTTIRAQGFKAKLVRVPSDQPAGQVVAQDPRAGANAQTGSAIRLNLSDGTKASPAAPAVTRATTEQPTPAAATRAPAPATSSVRVPDLEGMKLVGARKQLRRLGLVLEIKRVPNALPRDTIVAQARKPDTTLERGDHLLVTVSSGPKQPAAQSIAIPDVTGEDEATAWQDLEDAGLVVRLVDQDTTDPSEDGVVIDQAPPADQSASTNSTVTIYVGRLSGG